MHLLLHLPVPPPNPLLPCTPAHGEGDRRQQQEDDGGADSGEHQRFNLESEKGNEKDASKATFHSLSLLLDPLRRSPTVRPASGRGWQTRERSWKSASMLQNPFTQFP